MPRKRGRPSTGWLPAAAALASYCIASRRPRGSAMAGARSLHGCIAARWLAGVARLDYLRARNILE